MCEIGQRIREARELRGMSAINLANAIGVSRATVYRYEDGYIEKLPLNIISHVADTLNVSVEWLMGTSENMAPKKAPNPGYVLLEGQAEELFDYYRQLDPERAARLVGYAQALADAQQTEQELSKTNEGGSCHEC